VNALAAENGLQEKRAAKARLASIATQSASFNQARETDVLDPDDD
jgi:hypothetical protein